MISLVKRFLIALIIIAVLYALNLAMSKEGLFGSMSKEGLFGFGVPLYQVDLWKMAGINIILAVSLNLINGFTGQFSIGHIGFMAVGAYSSTFMTVYYTQGLEQWLAGILGASVAAAIVFALVIVIGALAAAVAGLIVGIPSLRLRGDYLAIATLGFAEIIRIVLVNMNKVGGATGFRGCVDPITNITCSDPSLGRLTIPAYTNFFWIGFLAVITIVVIYNIVNSDMGRALISIREDELAAQAMGVNTTRYKVTAFVISSAFAGVAGALYGHWRLPHPNDFTFVRSFEIIIMIVLGGMGSITGAVLGALVITILPELLRTYPYEIVMLLALIPVTALILRAIGRERLPKVVQSKLAHFAFVAAIYLVLFGLSMLLMNFVLGLDLVLLGLIPLGALVVNSLPKVLRAGIGNIILIVALMALVVALLVLPGGMQLIVLDAWFSDVMVIALLPVIALVVSSRIVGFKLTRRVVQTAFTFAAIFLALFEIVRLLIHAQARVSGVIGDITRYRLVIYALLLIIIMITRPQGILGNYEIASWLKRARKRPEGDAAVGGSTGAPIAEQSKSTKKSEKELENR
jgi:branched-chain amino acid transport system permease protein